jgi:hypothetical protein
MRSALKDLETLTNCPKRKGHALSVESAHKLSEEKTLTICRAKPLSSMRSELKDLETLTNCPKRKDHVLSVESAHKLSKEKKHSPFAGQSPRPPCAQH